MYWCSGSEIMLKISLFCKWYGKHFFLKRNIQLFQTNFMTNHDSNQVVVSRTKYMNFYDIVCSEWHWLKYNTEHFILNVCSLFKKPHQVFFPNKCTELVVVGGVPGTPPSSTGGGAATARGDRAPPCSTLPRPCAQGPASFAGDPTVPRRFLFCAYSCMETEENTPQDGPNTGLRYGGGGQFLTSNKLFSFFLLQQRKEIPGMALSSKTPQNRLCGCNFSYIKTSNFPR